MSLSIPGRWIWDFWLARDGTDWHVFFLQAPKSLGDPDRRHRNATIGHARSEDLRRWEVLDDPVPLGEPGEWDDLALWTGSVIRSGQSWWMFYTGVSTADDGLIQRIGAARSGDLTAWDKVPQSPMLEADPRWYEKYDPNAWYEEAWRDPWVFPDPDGAGFQMFITARVAEGRAATRGVIACARSTDLTTWTVEPPVAEPEWFGNMEVPQQVSIGSRHYLIFSVSGDMQPLVPDAESRTGIAYLVADQPGGPYRPGPTPFVHADRRGSLCAGRIVFVDDEPMMLATLHCDPEGRYEGSLSDPMPVVVGDDGSLSLASPGE